MGNKTCYIINFYLGERRRTIKKVNDDKMQDFISFVVKEINESEKAV